MYGHISSIHLIAQQELVVKFCQSVRILRGFVLKKKIPQTHKHLLSLRGLSPEEAQKALLATPPEPLKKRKKPNKS